jgi:activator of HSP90 ATPase
MSNAFTLTITLPVAPDTLYRAWLSGNKHAAFTGSPATGSAKVGAKFTAWEGYISGKNIELKPGKRIVQSWRTTEFPEGVHDSRLELLFAAAKSGTKLTLIHLGLPADQVDEYRRGWKEFYFAPMREYFKK